MGEQPPRAELTAAEELHKAESDGRATPSSLSAVAKDSAGAAVDTAGVHALLERLLKTVESVQESQVKMEQRQGDIEGTVKAIEAEVEGFCRAHAATAGAVRQVLEKARKVSANVKDVRVRLDKQSHEVKKLEANHAELMKRNNFRIMVYQEGSDAPISIATSSKRSKSELATGGAAAAAAGGAAAGAGGAEPRNGAEASVLEASPKEIVDESTNPFEADAEALNLSSDEDVEMIEEVESTASKLRRTGKKRVESIKKAFSRENFEKKVNRIVSPEKREKIKSTFTHRHKASADAGEAHGGGEPSSAGDASAGEAPSTPGETRRGDDDKVEVRDAHGVAAEVPADPAAPGTPSSSTASQRSSSMKRMENMKKAMSRENIEKKVDTLGRKIVPPEKRDKIKKSLTPDHKKGARSNTSSFKVPPFSFTVKKFREGDAVEVEDFEIDPNNVEILSGSETLPDDHGHHRALGETPPPDPQEPHGEAGSPTFAARIAPPAPGGDEALAALASVEQKA
uniref:Caveolae-associated protein 2-like n=1 Tax=Petromyzon marinus TaxID=7757 RepID=A0AAJ7T8D0_PETMA|nr:caveolae-associated protein 2-like [Petromyzon marinus]